MTEPNSLPSLPALAVIVMIFGTSVVATVWAASRSLASRRSRARRILAAWSTAPAVATKARPRGSR